MSGNRGLISGFCSSLKWINLSTLSSEVKVTTKIAGIVYNIQQLEEEIEMPDMEPMTLATDSRSVTQVVADPGRHRTMTTHVDRDAFKVRESYDVAVSLSDGVLATRTGVTSSPNLSPTLSSLTSGTPCVATSNGSFPTHSTRLQPVLLL